MLVTFDIGAELIYKIVINCKSQFIKSKKRKGKLKREFYLAKFKNRLAVSVFLSFKFFGEFISQMTECNPCDLHSYSIVKSLISNPDLERKETILGTRFEMLRLLIFIFVCYVIF